MIEDLSHGWGFPSPQAAYRSTAGSFAESKLLFLSTDKAHAELGWRATCSHSEMVRAVSNWYAAPLTG